MEAAIILGFAIFGLMIIVLGVNVDRLNQRVTELEKHEL